MFFFSLQLRKSPFSFLCLSTCLFVWSTINTVSACCHNNCFMFAHVVEAWWDCETTTKTVWRTIVWDVWSQISKGPCFLYFLCCFITRLSLIWNIFKLTNNFILMVFTWRNRKQTKFHSRPYGDTWWFNFSPHPLQTPDESMASVGSEVPYVNDQILLDMVVAV